MLKLARLDDRPEIFLSLQGEGTRAGRPSVFVRTSLCNLHCTWCDTDYTWNWEDTSFPHERDKDPNYKKYQRDKEIISVDVGEAARLVAAHHCPNVVLTGGEPLLQQTALLRFMRLLRVLIRNVHFEVETNGTVLPDKDFLNLCNQFNVSPKLSNSGNTTKESIHPRVLRLFADTNRAWFKFVISGPEDIQEILSLVEDARLPKNRVLLMPEGRSEEDVATHLDLAVQLCMEHGFTFTDRLHLRLFGTKRGV
jgi:organic radical activating enzyme